MFLGAVTSFRSSSFLLVKLILLIGDREVGHKYKNFGENNIAMLFSPKFLRLNQIHRDIVGLLIDRSYLIARINN